MRGFSVNQEEYELFEVLLDGAPMWRGHVHRIQNAREKLTELSTTTKNECFAMDLRTKEVVLRLNVTQNPQ